jgi:Tfp pilus assembly protein PilO
MNGFANRMWVLGGAIGAAALVAVTWFFLISPQRAETEALKADAAAAHERTDKLQRRLTQLRTENNDFSKYQAQLTRDRQALPTESALSDYLRQLQEAGDASRVSVSSVLIGEPDLAAAGGGQIYKLPITMTVSGTASTLSRYLDQIQKIQPRAVLVGTASVIAADPTTSINGTAGMTLNLEVYVAAPAGATPKAQTQHQTTTQPTSEGTD